MNEPITKIIINQLDINYKRLYEKNLTQYWEKLKIEKQQGLMK